MDHSDVSDSAKKRMSKFGLACLKCRSRKIKCDSRKPVCENCEKKGFECVFDETPKTRGPDKNPGRKRRTAAQMHAEAKLLRGQGLSETSKKSSAKAASSLSSIEKNQAFSNQFNHSAEFSSQQQIPTFLSPKIDESSSDGRRSTSSNDMLSASSSSGLLIDSSHVLASNPSHPSNHVADLRRPGPPFASGFPSQSADADEGSSDPSSLPIKFHHQHQQTRHHHRHQQQNHYIHPSAIASSYTYGAPPLSLPPPQMFSHPSGTYYSSQDPSMNARLSYPDQSNNETSQLAESHSPMRQPSQATSVHLALVSPVPSNSNQNMTSSQNNSYQLGYDNPRTQYQRYQQQNDLQQMQASSINPSHSGHVYQYPSSAPASGESQLSSGYQHYNQQRALYQQSRQSMYQAPTVSSSFPPYYQPRLPLTSTPTPVYDQAQHMEYYPPLHQQQQPDFSHQAYQSSPRLLGKRRSEEAFDQVPEQSAASQVEPVRTNDILKQPDRPPMSSRRTREDGQYMLELELSGKEKIEAHK
ncbi:Zn(2)-C6 fungal-type DNA-binding domain [Phaffia rhodozyma]|uniref:Zn(2)-C6 fungal-type DNA-binding domain n=1 Tax=Phaffia rhodozyma TaxID=264483 RepID=A0A0F7SQJ8_PHARH|nr:Zn(2)-C6 fungal-type DNA-binding domain [Phaffia rhodozyma]